MKRSVIGIFFALASTQSLAAGVLTGQVGMLEVWRNGNIAFTLNPGVDTGCQAAGQFILNASEPGTRNQLAVLITAKASRKQVQVYIRSCGAAAGYGGDYAIPEYLYLLD